MNATTVAWMASMPGTMLWRRHHTADGNEKRCYAKEAAVTIAQRMTAQDGEPMEAYECHCRCWHVGASTGQR